MALPESMHHHLEQRLLVSEMYPDEDDIVPLKVFGGMLRRMRPPGAAAGVLLSLASACAAPPPEPPPPRSPTSTQKSASPVREEVPTRARVVLQSHRPQRFVRLATGGRFALFRDTVVDLEHFTVAWSGLGEPLDADAGPHHGVFARSGGSWGGAAQASLVIQNLLTGAETVFPGAPVRHVALGARGAALWTGRELRIVDTVAREERFVVRPDDVPNSVAASRDWGRLYVMSEALRETRTEKVRLSVFTRGDAAPVRRQLGVSREEAFNSFPDGASTRASFPFLRVGEAGALTMSFLSGCPTCRARMPLTLYSLPLDPRTGAPTGPWGGRLVRPDESTDDLPDYPGRFCSRWGCQDVMSTEMKARIDGIGEAERDYVVGVCPDGDCFYTGSLARLCRWSLSAGRPTRCADGLDARYQVATVATSQEVFMMRLDDPTTATLALSNVETGQWATRTFEAEVTLNGWPFVFAPRGLRFLVLRRRQGGPIGIEMWTWDREAPEWTRDDCATPTFSADGASVLCAMFDPSAGQAEGPVLELDATTGAARGPQKTMPLPRVRPSPLPCRLRLMADGRLLVAGQRVATFYPFADGQWATVLADGQYDASSTAMTRFAFYAPDGELMSREAIALLQQPDIVRSHVMAARRCGPR